MKIVIPARYASSRLPGKPLLPVAGKPLLEHVHTLAGNSIADEVVVATDDDRIARAAESFGAEICMTSSDHSSGTERIAEVIQKLGWAEDEIVVNLQGDEPLVPVELLNQVATDLEAHEAAEMTTVCAPLEDVAQIFDPNVVKLVTDVNGYALYFSRAPIPWHRDTLAWGEEAASHHLTEFARHIGLYAYRAGFVGHYTDLTPAPMEEAESLEQLRVLWHGHKIHVAQTDHAPPAGVDTEEDLVRIRSLLEAT
ncbi:MAG: 3-deoxy-manno-octulosonate cytidylyltransferase [bacterium]